jgi:alpha-amylase/alpha-mannosidase (GH57 family)
LPVQHKLDVVLCWHMHQPWYLCDGSFAQPWVYLHGLRSYADMAAHLETVEGARAVVNFAPVLLEQLEMYADDLGRHLEAGAPLRDPLLEALAAKELPADAERRNALVRQCLQVNEPRVLRRFGPFARLAEVARAAEDAGGSYLNDRFLGDLLTWFHLAWCGEYLHKSDATLARLIQKGTQFSRKDRRELLAVIARELAGLTGRYRALAESGRVELSVSPWAHPILPLLLDPGAAREALPDAKLPPEPRYPGGEARAKWHLERAIATFERHFGGRPAGCWPSEGALSTAAVRLIEAAGFDWTASGGAVLHNSVQKAGLELQCRHHPYVVGDGRVRCFFRDDGLSDQIGFAYQSWPARDAVADLVRHLENIAAHCNARGMIAAIIMDGENAWEHYPENGFEFLQTLYRTLAAHPRLRLTTFSEHLAGSDTRAVGLPALVAGSWVHGTLSTWIGNAPKNRAWELLIAAKQAYDALPAKRRQPDTALTRHLGICEGSDWFWWLDDFIDAAAVARFEALFRSQLRGLYRKMKAEMPPALAEPLVTGTAGGAVSTMRPAHDSES